MRRLNRVKKELADLREEIQGQGALSLNTNKHWRDLQVLNFNSGIHERLQPNDYLRNILRLQ